MLVLGLSSCGTLQVPVKINDETLYFLKGSSGAVEENFLSSGETDLTEAEWRAIEVGMVAMPLSAFDDFNTEIGKLCSQVPCDYQTVSKFHALARRLHRQALLARWFEARR